MKKFISMVMAAAMVVSMVPATAFAANTATFKVVGAEKYTEKEAEKFKKSTIVGPELNIKITDVDTKTATDDDFEITLDFENAEIKSKVTTVTDKNGWVTFSVEDDGLAEDDTITLKAVEGDYNLAEDAVIVIDMKDLNLVLTNDNAGTEATVEVSGDFGDSDPMVFASVKDEGITVTLKDVAEVAEEEVTKLEKSLKIEADVDAFKVDQEIEMKLSKGFEWDVKSEACFTVESNMQLVERKENVLTFKIRTTESDEITFDADDLWIEAVDAKEGDVCTITVKAKETTKVDGAFKATGNVVDAVVVVGEGVSMTVDADEDVPVFYSGVNSADYGLTSDDDHKSLKVTFEENVKNAFDEKKAFTLTLTEGVFVTDVEISGNNSKLKSVESKSLVKEFKEAYEEGEYDCFKFNRKEFKGDRTAAFEFDATFKLIAVPGFEGPVTLTLGGDAFENEVEVVIAEFVSPYKVAAEQNDVLIDYRHTAVSPIVVTEADAGLWAASDMEFRFSLDKSIGFDGKATYTVNEDDSDMEIKAFGKNELGFTVKEESDDEAAVVTISDIELYMERNVPAGAFDLEMGTTAGYAMMTEGLFTDEKGADGVVGSYCVADYADWDYSKADGYDVEYGVVCPAYVNVVTAGRDQENTVLVPSIEMTVGATEMYVNGMLVENPAGVAPINTGDRVLMPVRCVANLLGISNDDVIWNAETRTVTILFDGKVIAMTIGESVFFVNGVEYPATGKVLIQDGYTYIGSRDLARALGVEIAYADGVVTIN